MSEPRKSDEESNFNSFYANCCVFQYYHDEDSFTHNDRSIIVDYPKTCDKGSSSRDAPTVLSQFDLGNSLNHQNSSEPAFTPELVPLPLPRGIHEKKRVQQNNKRGAVGTVQAKKRARETIEIVQVKKLRWAVAQGIHN